MTKIKYLIRKWEKDSMDMFKQYCHFMNEAMKHPSKADTHINTANFYMWATCRCDNVVEYLNYQMDEGYYDCCGY